MGVVEVVNLLFIRTRTQMMNLRGYRNNKGLFGQVSCIFVWPVTSYREIKVRTGQVSNDM